MHTLGRPEAWGWMVQNTTPIIEATSVCFEGARVCGTNVSKTLATGMSHMEPENICGWQWESKAVTSLKQVELLQRVS